MKTKNFYKKLTSTLAFAFATVLISFVQTSPLTIVLHGEQIVAQQDPNLSVNGDLYLSVNAGIGDSVVWNIWNGDTLVGNNILAKNDMNGYVLLKHNGIWTYNFFSFQGIIQGSLNLNGVLYNNALMPKYSSNNVYYFWSNNGGGGTVAFSRFYLNPTSGNYYLTIILPATNDTLSYSTYVYGPSDTSTAFNSTDIISQSGLQFGISNLYQPDSIIWKFSSSVDLSTNVESHQPTIEVLSDGIVSLYIRQNGQWYKQTEIFKGISYDSTVTGELIAPIIQNATYTWYKNDNLIPNATGTSYIPTVIGTYKVIIVLPASANARLAQQSNIATFEYNVSKVYIVSGFADNIVNIGNLTIYPNPANGFVNIATSGGFEYKIESTNASTMISGVASDAIQLDINHLNAGLYYVHIKSNNKESVKKLIVK